MSGVARNYIDSNYASVPNNHADLLNGHAMFIYYSNESGITKTSVAIQGLLNTSLPQQGRVSTLVGKIKKFKRLTNDKELCRFKELCNETFHVFCSDHRRKAAPCRTPSSSAADLVCVNVSEKQVPSCKPTECVKCSALRARLKKAVEQRRSIHQKHVKQINKLRLQLHKRQNLRVLNQKLKRKDDQIRRLTTNSVTSTASTDSKSMLELKTLKRKCHHLEKQLSNAKSAIISLQTTECDQLKELEQQINVKFFEIVQLQNNNLVLEETVSDLSAETKSSKVDKKSFSRRTRLFVYDAIVNQVPTKNVPIIIEKFAQRSGFKFDSVPQRNSVEMMARELGVISDYQAADLLMSSKDVTIGFDATTQEGVHINSIHYTTHDRCLVMAIDQLPGGTAIDYQQHIIQSIDHLCSVYTEVNNANYQDTRTTMISNISNTMTDRASVNHATIELLNESLNKNLNELNCHLHPLDTIATSCRTTLKSLETEPGKIFGHDCFAANIILQMNKMRYKDGKGDPKGFVTFLDKEHLPRGLITRYRGNRLHVLFHLAGIYSVYHATFLNFLTNGTVSCGGLQGSLRADFSTSVAKSELHVLGLIGKLFTGPWMQRFYRSAGTQIDHLDGIDIVRNVIGVLEKFAAQPMSTLSCSTDLLGGDLNLSDSVLPGTNKTIPKDHILSVLRSPPSNQDLFCGQMSACLTSCVTVLQRQYKRYFNVQVTDELHMQTKSARTHNIDAEEVMGMFSAAQKRAPNATLGYLSSRIRAQKNSVMDYIDQCDDAEQEKLIQFAIPLARKIRSKRLNRHNEMRLELIRRENRKLGQKEASQRKKVEKKVKTLNRNNLDTEFPELDDVNKQNVLDILEGKIIGRNICHTWCDSDTHEKTVYNGKIEKMKRKKSPLYVVAYWPCDSDYNQAVDYDISKFELVADYICDDLVLS